MSLALILGCLWVLASVAVALMPMRRQYAPGLFLLCAAPILIIYIGVEHGWLYSVASLVAFLSMFRNPLIYIIRKAMGLPVKRPEHQEEQGA